MPVNLLGVGKRIDHYKHLNIFFSTFDRSDPNGLHLTLDNGSVGFVTLAILKRVFFFQCSLFFECPHICWNCHVSVVSEVLRLCGVTKLWFLPDCVNFLSCYFDTTVSLKRFPKTNALGNSPRKRHDYKRKIVVYYSIKLLSKTHQLRQTNRTLSLRLGGFRPQALFNMKVMYSYITSRGEPV